MTTNSLGQKLAGELERLYSPPQFLAAVNRGAYPSIRGALPRVDAEQFFQLVMVQAETRPFLLDLIEQRSLSADRLLELYGRDRLDHGAVLERQRNGLVELVSYADAVFQTIAEQEPTCWDAELTDQRTRQLETELELLHADTEMWPRTPAERAQRVRDTLRGAHLDHCQRPGRGCRLSEKARQAGYFFAELVPLAWQGTPSEGRLRDFLKANEEALAHDGEVYRTVHLVRSELWRPEVQAELFELWVLSRLAEPLSGRLDLRWAWSLAIPGSSVTRTWERSGLRWPPSNAASGGEPTMPAWGIGSVWVTVETHQPATRVTATRSCSGGPLTVVAVLS